MCATPRVARLMVKLPMPKSVVAHVFGSTTISKSGPAGADVDRAFGGGCTCAAVKDPVTRIRISLAPCWSAGTPKSIRCAIAPRVARTHWIVVGAASPFTFAASDAMEIIRAASGSGAGEDVVAEEVVEEDALPGVFAAQLAAVTPRAITVDAAQNR